MILRREYMVYLLHFQTDTIFMDFKATFLNVWHDFTTCIISFTWNALFDETYFQVFTVKVIKNKYYEYWLFLS